MENVKVDCLVRKKREGKGKEGEKKIVGLTIFFPSNVGRKKERKFFLTTMKSKITLLSIFEEIKK